MGFGSTKKKNEEQTKLRKKPQKNTIHTTKNDKDAKKEITKTSTAKIDIETSEKAIPEIKNANVEFETTDTISKSTNKNIQKGEYYDLGKDTLKIFYKHTNGMNRANDEQWKNIYQEYANTTGSKITLSSFKVYVNKTKQIHIRNSENKRKKYISKNETISQKTIPNSLKNSKINEEISINKISIEKNLSKVYRDDTWSSNKSQYSTHNETNIGIKNKKEKLVNDGDTPKILNSSNKILTKHKFSLKKTINSNKTYNFPKQTSFKYVRVLSPQERKSIHTYFMDILSQVRTEDNLRFQKCYKIPNDKLDWAIVDQINHEIKLFIEKQEKIQYQEIIDLLTTAQITYHKLTKRETQNKNNPRTSVLSKIEILDGKLKYIDSIRDCFQNINKNEIIFKDIVNKFGKINTIDDLNTIEHKIKNIVLVLSKKIKRDDEYRELKRINYKFELNRKSFYKDLEKGEEKDNLVPTDLKASDIAHFWKEIWGKSPSKYKNYEDALSLFKEKSERISLNETIPISDGEFQKLIQELQLWKSPGLDGIYSFWIKYMTSLHQSILNTFRNFFNDINYAPEYFFHGRTIFIPKDDGSTVDKLRPITCQSNIYKLFTKLLKNRLVNHVESHKIISINQAGSIPHIHAAKEQFLINKSITKNHNKKTKVAYIDVKKAFDTIDRNFLRKILDIIKAPPEILKFLDRADKCWASYIQYKGKTIEKIQFNRGIPQGDSLSPLFFTIVMEYITKELQTNNIPTFHFEIENRNHNLNHLLYIDDIKLFSDNEYDLQALLNKSKKSLENIGMNLNIEKCGANTNIIIAEQSIETDIYKYLGILEESKKGNSDINHKIIEQKILIRVENVLKSNLYSRNKVTALNEYALSVLNYFVGLINMNGKFCRELDNQIRKLMIQYNFHFADASIERLYLPRKINGRGIKSVSDHVETLGFNFSNYISEKNTIRKKIIIKGLESSPESKTLYYKNLIIEKYSLPRDAKKTLLIEKQNEKHILTLKEKIMHGTFFKKIEEYGFSISSNNLWLLYGNHTSSTEAYNFLMQDRYLSSFYKAGRCKFCKKCNISIDHLATRCGMLLHSSYIRRHNEVIKSIHLRLLNKYGISTRKKLKNHKIEKVVKNDKAEILTEIPIRTDTHVRNNKPDIVVFDNEKELIYLIDIGITSIENLKKYEIEKVQKYRLLAKEMEQLYSKKVIIVPYVITWDGVATEFNKKYRKIIDIDDRLHAYIQGVCLRLTSEILDLCLNNFTDSTNGRVKRKNIISNVGSDEKFKM
ncbi:Retrovirus-related Pol polyprotein from type-1 retrotransposable element R2 [Dictyocoela muelleri]|nr:Retrovirus-related Pol polyprotein from type-1 retrotransposable element R2 [Dictyocoela muelleri]